MQTENEIVPSTRRRLNGWQSTLEFPNGGIQTFSSLYHTHDAALKTARKLLKNRLLHPNKCIFDPGAHTIVEI